MKEVDFVGMGGRAFQIEAEQGSPFAGGQLSCIFRSNKGLARLKHREQVTE